MDETMSVLNQFYGTVGHLILDYQATLEQFVGDSIMAIFNDPVPCVDHTAQAVRMAVESRDGTNALAQGWRLNGYDLDVGIGIAEGHATLGRVGFEGRFDYRATGTVVNLAARLCAHATGGQILLAPKAYAAVTDIVDVEAVGPLQLKGLPQPIQASASRRAPDGCSKDVGPIIRRQARSCSCALTEASARRTTCSIKLASRST